MRNRSQNQNRYQNIDSRDRFEKKKSGAKMSMFKTRDGVTGISIHAWNHSSDRGLLTAKGFENSKSTTYENEQGEKSTSVMLEVFWHRTGVKRLILGWYKHTTGKIFLQELGMVISTKAPNGGYFGKM